MILQDVLNSYFSTSAFALHKSFVHELEKYCLDVVIVVVSRDSSVT